MNWHTMAGTASTMALFLPVLFILFCKLFQNFSLLTLLFYYLLTSFYNLTALNLFPVSANALHFLGTIVNYLDVPLMLVVLLFFCNEVWKRQMIYITLGLFILLEVFIAYNFGRTQQSSVYLLGAGTPVILLYSIYFFVHFGKQTIVQGKSIGKTLMLVSIVFAYGCFLVIYFLHYIQKTPAVADVFLVYYIVNTIASVLMCVGLYWIYKRVGQLKEVQKARRELATFFEY